MAIVGNAYVYVRAITEGVEDDIRRGLNKSGSTAGQSGRKAGENWQREFDKARGKGRFTGLFSPRFEARASRAREQLFRLVTVSNLLTPAITGAVGGLSSLVTSLFSLGSAAASAAPSLIVLPAALTAVAQAAVTARLAFGGVGQAISAGLRGGGGGGGSPANQVRDLADQIEDALDRVAEARRRLSQTIRDNVDRRLEAIEAARRAEEEVESRVAAATRAQRDYADAQYNTRQALEAVSDARKQAIEDLQQLRFAAEGAVLGEERARLAFERSRDALQRVQDLPPNSRARQAAELAFKEADLNLRRAIDRNSDLQKEEEEATKAGVEGSDAVLDAKDSLRDARRAEEDALQAVIEANKDVVRARIDAAKAARDIGKVERDNLQRRREAVQDLIDALEDYEDTREEQFRNEQNRSGGGSDPFAEAMKNLSKEAQDFVRYIISIQDEFRKLRAAAGRDLFPQLEIAIDNLVRNLFPRLEPLLESTGDSLGKIAIKISETITKSENLARLDRVWENGNELLEKFGDAAANLYEIFLILLDAAAPIIDKFGDWVVTLTETWLATLKAKDASGELTRNFINAGKTASQLGRIFNNLFGGLKQLFNASVGPGSGGQFLLDWLETITAKFEEFGKMANEDGSLVYFFKQSAITAAATLGLIGDILAILAKLGADPNTTLFVETLRQAVPIWENILLGFNQAGPALAELIVVVSRVLLAFQDLDALRVYFDTLIFVVKALARVFESELFQAIFGVIAPIFAVAAALRLVIKILAFFGRAIAGIAISAFVSSMKMLGFRFDQAALASARAATGVQRFNLALKAMSFSNPWMLALTALTTVLGVFWMRSEGAKQRAQEFADTLDKTTGSITTATEQLVALKISEIIGDNLSLTDVVNATDMDMKQIVDSVTQGGAALEELLGRLADKRAEIEERISALQNDPTAKEAYEGELAALLAQSDAYRRLYGDLKNNSSAINTATTEAQRNAEAQRLLEESAEAARGSFKDQAVAFGENLRTLTDYEYQVYEAEKAQAELQGQTDALRDAFTKLNDKLSNERAAIDLRRQYRDLEKQVKENGKTFTGFGKDADKNKELVLDAVSTIQRQVEDLGLGPEETAVKFAEGLEEMRQAFIDAGFDEDDLDTYLAGIKATPDQAQEIFEEIDKAGKDAVDQYMKQGIAAGDGFIEGLRSRAEQAYQTGKYVGDEAGRGIDDSKVGGMASPSKETRKLGRWVAEGLALGIRDRGADVRNSFYDTLNDMAEKGGEGMRKFTDKVRGIVDVFIGDLEQIGTAANDFITDIEEALNPPELTADAITDPVKFATDAMNKAAEAARELDEELTGGAIGTRKRANLIADYENISATLKEELILALDAAQAKLDEWRQQAENFATSVQSALRGGVDINDARQRAEDEGKTVQQVLDEQLGKTRAFVDKTVELIDAGYSEATVQSVIARGVEGGTLLAQALLDAGTSMLETDKSIEGELQRLGERLTEAGMNAFYQAGIDNAEENLKGVKSQLEAATSESSPVMTAMDSLATALGRDVKIKIRLNKRNFNVKINVKRFIRDVAFPEVKAAQGGIVRRPTIALVGEAGPEAIVPLGKSKGNSPLPGGGLGGVTVNVYPSAGMNEEELANKVSRRLAYDMRRGAV